jgi:hypothetical protein
MREEREREERENFPVTVRPVPRARDSERGKPTQTRPKFVPFVSAPSAHYRQHVEAGLRF